MADAEDIKRFHAGEHDLSQSDFRQANLSGFDFRGRDLTGSKFGGANIVGARFDNCNLYTVELPTVDAREASFIGATMPGPIFGANFTESDLRGAKFSRSNLARCNFTRANLSGADFTFALFDADVIFDEAFVDDKTDFQDAQVLRPASRLPIFSNYNFERGVLRRKAVEQTIIAEQASEVVSQHAGSSTAPSSTPDSSLAVELQRIRTSLRGSAGSPREMAASLALAVREHIDLIAGARPNEPDQLARFDNYVALLEAIAEGLLGIAQSLDEVHLGPASEKSEKALNTASNLIVDLSRSIRIWLDNNGQQLIGMQSTAE